MSSRRLNICNMEGENKVRTIFEFLLRLLLALPFMLAEIVRIAAVVIVEVMRFQTD